MLSTDKISVITTFIIGCALVIILSRLKSRIKGKRVPQVEKGLPFFGHVFTMLKGSPWDQMARWAIEYGTFYKLHLFGSDAYVVSDPALLKIVLQTKLRPLPRRAINGL